MPRLADLFCASARSVASTSIAPTFVTPGPATSLSRWVARLFLVVGLAGCSGLEPVATHDETTTDPAKLYMLLTLDHPAVTLDTTTGYNTLQLTATPRNALREPLADLPAPTFLSSDTTAVHVTAGGLLTARKAAANVRIIAELVAPGNVRHADTAMVNVTTLAPPPELASLSLDPVPPDSAIAPIGFDGKSVLVGQAMGTFGTKQLTPPIVLNTIGGTINGLQIEYTSLDPTIATVGRRDGLMMTISPGLAHIVARTTAYGETRADTVQFTVTLPGGASVVARSRPDGTIFFGPADVVIRPYGIVYWFTSLGTTVDVAFDDPTHVASPSVCYALPVLAPFFSVASGHLDPTGPHCAAGNLDLLPNPTTGPSPFFLPVTIRIRQFPVPGVYPYRSTLTGATGRIIVSNTVVP